MGNLKTLLEGRFKKNTQTKMEALTRKRMEGELSPFLARLSHNTLSPEEKEKIRVLLNHYNCQEYVEEHDLTHLCSLSAKVKQIHHQAVLLHGEHIKQARYLLKRYREGAFSAWMILAYGNRQTPYNFLVYYELFTLLPDSLKKEIEKMPKQAVYTLASRQGPQEKKEEIIRNYRGEGKGELLDKIRKEFPLLATDSRQTSPTKQALTMLSKGSQLLSKCSRLSLDEKTALEKLIKKLERVKSNLFSDFPI
ncbi:pGP6-D family virulence protein [Candidatus Chlamydia sanziniae]|uniref:Virulence plasmid protein pGP6-D n=1 Tax=Candidatus Chlamydia sanziniae TaxID=1806891 RepID=A0A1A9HX40_9CHLA|nr:pGP6-D family virulence protein [Candidatus Chlamydia sanziniae]ANH78604.1 Virulence plasmid protein pGP6-D [Candidatus Chlamydia sanziniae]